MAKPKMTTKPSVDKDRQEMDLFYAADVSTISTSSMANCFITIY